MALLISSNLADSSFARKYIFLDNDFLSVLFNDFDALRTVTTITAKGYLLIEPLTKFEFLQSVYLPRQRELKERFISNDRIFYSAADHQTIFQQQRTNALTLSNLYAHNNCTGASVIDLFLASRAIIHSNALIITGNKKHFPSALFDVEGIFNYEQKDGQITAFPIISFSNSKYKEAVARLNKVK